MDTFDFYAVAPLTLARITSLSTELSEILVFPFIAATYGLGVGINFAVERVTKSYWYKHYRDAYYEKEGLDYKKDVRGIVFGNARKEIIEDLRHGMHIIRVSRSSALNFFLIAAALFLHWRGNELIVLIASIISLVIAILAYFEGMTRFKRNHERTLAAYRELKRQVS